MGEMGSVLYGARILAVDDEVLHLRSLDRALQGEGCKVTKASSVPEALAAIEAEDVGFHAAVIDYMLLDRFGSEVVKALCEGERFTASIVLTGKPSRAVVADAYRSGVHSTLTKPVPLDVLLPELRACIDKTITVRHQCNQATHQKPANNQEAVLFTSAPAGPLESGDYSIAFARREDRATALAKQGGLSERERQVLLEVFTGRKNADIAQRLEIAERTVKFHISNINKKLSVKNRGELMALLAGDRELPPLAEATTNGESAGGNTTHAPHEPAAPAGAPEPSDSTRLS